MHQSLPYRRPLSYAMARTHFREVAAASGARLVTHHLPGREELGIDAEDLTIDVAELPCRDPSGPRLLISSGLHGLEGFAGSHAQTQWLLGLQDRELIPKYPIILVHSLNPYGFAMHRRWNEHGIDLNRNFRLDTEPYEGCPDAYRKLHDFINPSYAPRAFDSFWLEAPLQLARFGQATLNQAIASGQYVYPRGLFFGGTEASACKRFVDAELQHWAGARDSRILHIDLHTGLGRKGEVQLFLDSPSSPEVLAQLRRSFHPRRIRGDDELVFEAPGAIGRYLAKVLGSRYCGLTLEMGTLSPATLFRLLRRENQAHQVCGYESDAARRARETLLDAFAPQETSWWESVMPKVIRTLWDAMDSLDEMYEPPQA